MKEIYEAKSRDKDEEIKRLREIQSKNEGEQSRIKEELGLKNERVRALENEISGLRVREKDFMLKAERNALKIKGLKKQCEDLLTVT